ncbi:MAG: hypothetical protein K2W84_16605 [Burkholderiales bacterium]|nr:hypothetical protein [Burkholderiales bacterium]
MNFTRLLHHALRSLALRGMLAALLLFAQHGALTHALVHASGHAHETVVAVAHEQGGDHGHDHAHEAPGEGRSALAACDFDLLYSELLGGALLIDSTLRAEAVVPVAVIPVTVHVASITTLHYHSRGPPSRA